VLFKVKDIAVVAIDEFGDGGVQALTFGTLHQKHRGVFHQKSSFFRLIVREIMRGSVDPVAPGAEATAKH